MTKNRFKLFIFKGIYASNTTNSNRVQMSTTGTAASSKMARSTKTSTPSVTSTPAQAAPVAAKTETKKVSKKAEAPAAAAAPPAPVVEVADASGSSVSFESVISTLETLRREVSAALTQVRELQKVSRRELRSAASSKKARRQRDPNAPPRKPSGITMPVEVSAEKFLGLGASELISRTSAAGKLTAYAREHKLFDEKNGRLIRPNAALKTLLRLGESDELTIPSLQKFIGVHFPPKKA